MIPCLEKLVLLIFLFHLLLMKSLASEMNSGFSFSSAKSVDPFWSTEEFFTRDLCEANFDSMMLAYLKSRFLLALI